MIIPLPARLAISMRAVWIFFGILSVVVDCGMIDASPVIGKVYPWSIVDVDGRTLSTSDKVVTVLVLTTRPKLDKAREVGDRIPERCLGNPGYRMITVIQFGGTHASLMQYLLKASVRHGLDVEAGRLKGRYLEKGIKRDARRDLYAVVDFKGKVAAEFGVQSAPELRVLILSGDGTLLRDWTDVPSVEELAAALP